MREALREARLKAALYDALELVAPLDEETEILVNNLSRVLLTMGRIYLIGQLIKMGD